jgi:hypothetical protein
MSDFERRDGAGHDADDAELFAWLDRVWRAGSAPTDAATEPTVGERENFARWLDQEIEAVRQMPITAMPFYTQVFEPTDVRHGDEGLDWLAALEPPPASAPAPTAEETSAFTHWLDERIADAAADTAGGRSRGAELDDAFESLSAARAADRPTPAETARFERWLDERVADAAAASAFDR